MHVSDVEFDPHEGIKATLFYLLPIKTPKIRISIDPYDWRIVIIEPYD